MPTFGKGFFENSAAPRVPAPNSPPSRACLPKARQAVAPFADSVAIGSSGGTAAERSRTSTSRGIQAPEACASANSATAAGGTTVFLLLAKPMSRRVVLACQPQIEMSGHAGLLPLRKADISIWLRPDIPILVRHPSPGALDMPDSEG